MAVGPLEGSYFDLHSKRDESTKMNLRSSQFFGIQHTCFHRAPRGSNIWSFFPSSSCCNSPSPSTSPQSTSFSIYPTFPIPQFLNELWLWVLYSAGLTGSSHLLSSIHSCPPSQLDLQAFWLLPVIHGLKAFRSQNFPGFERSWEVSSIPSSFLLCIPTIRPLSPSTPVWTWR